MKSFTVEVTQEMEERAKYVERFGPIPLWAMRSLSPREMNEQIRQALRTGNPPPGWKDWEPVEGDDLLGPMDY